MVYDDEWKLSNRQVLNITFTVRDENEGVIWNDVIGELKINWNQNGFNNEWI